MFIFSINFRDLACHHMSSRAPLTFRITQYLHDLVVSIYGPAMKWSTSSRKWRTTGRHSRWRLNWMQSIPFSWSARKTEGQGAGFPRSRAQWRRVGEGRPPEPIPRSSSSGPGARGALGTGPCAGPASPGVYGAPAWEALWHQEENSLIFQYLKVTSGISI